MSARALMQEKKPEETSTEKKDEENDEEYDKEEKQAEKDVDEALDATKDALLQREKENAQLKDRYMRAVADFRNLQGTSKREMQKAKDFALQKFSKDLIETIDNFDHAVRAVDVKGLEKDSDLAKFYEGVQMTQNIFEKTLEKYGLKKIDPVDQEFDPNRHEAVFQVYVDGKEPGTVISVQQPGYELNGRVLRAPKVGVAKAKEE